MKSSNILVQLIKQLRDKYLYLKRKKYIKVFQKQLPETTSIFSMNCFAGRLYQDLNRKYTSPTAGLFFLPKDFIEIGKNINLIKREIEEIQSSKWKDIEKVKSSHGKYPIGRIKGTDIEIHFLHYPSFEVAIEKWKRRVERFNFNDYIFIGFCQNGWEEYPTYFDDFEQIPNNKKILFSQCISSKKISSSVYIKEFSNFSESPDPVRKAHIYYKYLINYLK